MNTDQDVLTKTTHVYKLQGRFCPYSESIHIHVAVWRVRTHYTERDKYVLFYLQLRSK